MKPSSPHQSLRNTAMSLRHVATHDHALAEIGRLTAFRMDGNYYHNDDQPGPPDRGVAGIMIPPSPLTPLELIDDACAFEGIADKLDRLAS